jgi:predicted metalloprotease with PDZ domain
MIVHEMIHGWVGGVSGPGNTQWFSEGVTTYLTARTGLVLGLEPVEDYADEVSGLAADYYPNPFRNVSADSAAEAFWIHKTGERLPYARGALYFFYLNHRIRQASNGSRSLDDVLLEFFEARDRGEPATTAAWLDRIEAELGPEAVATFDSIVVEGTQTIPLPPDALGPCFERRTEEATVPPFLYDRREGDRRLVAHVSEGTPPARAGLRTGDVVLTDFDPEEPPEPGETVVLEVRRGDATREITYEADPVRVESYEWDRVPDVADDVCREGP